MLPHNALAPPSLDPASRMPAGSVIPTTWDPDASGEIGQIIVEQNTKTNSETVEYIAGVEVGDSWNRDLIEPTRTKLFFFNDTAAAEIYPLSRPDALPI